MGKTGVYSSTRDSLLSLRRKRNEPHEEDGSGVGRGLLFFIFCLSISSFVCLVGGVVPRDGGPSIFTGSTDRVERCVEVVAVVASLSEPGV